jgi:hypothetical protein
MLGFGFGVWFGERRGRRFEGPRLAQVGLIFPFRLTGSPLMSLPPLTCVCAGLPRHPLLVPILGWVNWIFRFPFSFSFGSYLFLGSISPLVSICFSYFSVWGGGKLHLIMCRR